jgi:hypothetical protein
MFISLKGKFLQNREFLALQGPDQWIKEEGELKQLKDSGTFRVSS